MPFSCEVRASRDSGFAAAGCHVCLPSAHIHGAGSAREEPAQAHAAGLLIQCSHDGKTICELQIFPSPTSQNHLPHPTSTLNSWNPSPQFCHQMGHTKCKAMLCHGSYFRNGDQGLRLLTKS